MWKQDRASPGLRIQTLDDVLPESIVGAALRGRAVDVAAAGIRTKGVASPLFDGVRRISQAHIELLKPIASDKLRFGKRVTANDLKILDAVQKAIHPRDGRGHQISLLPEELDRPPF